MKSMEEGSAVRVLPSSSFARAMRVMRLLRGMKSAPRFVFALPISVGKTAMKNICPDPLT